SGFIDWPRMRSMNLARVQRAPPALVITDDRFDDPDATWSFRRSQPELYAYLAARYRRRGVVRGGGRPPLGGAGGGAAGAGFACLGEDGRMCPDERPCPGWTSEANDPASTACMAVSRITGDRPAATYVPSVHCSRYDLARRRAEHGG